MPRGKKIRLDAIPVELVVNGDVTARNPASRMTEEERHAKCVEIIAKVMRRALGIDPEPTEPFQTDSTTHLREENSMLEHMNFLTSEEVRKKLRISKAKLWRLTQSRQIPSHKVGERSMYLETDIEAYLASVRIERKSDPAA